MLPRRIAKRKKKILKSKKISGNRRDTRKIQTISSNVNKFLGAANLDEIARKTEFLQRATKITPFIFVYALSMGLFGPPISLDMLAVNMNTIFSINLTGQAFCLRMNAKSSVLFLKACFENFLRMQLESSFVNSFHDAFAGFKEVILEDSTVLELNETVRKNFKGSGGAASKSSLKLNWVFNICQYAAVAVNIFSGNVPDQKIAKKSLRYIKKGTLLIRDLGYFTFESFRLIILRGAYFLSRLHKCVKVYQNEHDTIPLDMPLFLKKLTAGGKSAKVSVYIGQEERIAVDLIVQKVPRKVLNQRLKKQIRKKEKAPSAEFIEWAKYSIFITNAPDELWTQASSKGELPEISTIIIEVYKIRWQIELLFKKFKSIINLHIIKGKNKNRVLCLIYGRLIGIMLSLMVLSYAATHKYQGREISLWKITCWLIDRDRLANAILDGKLCRLYADLRNEIRLLCKNRRRRSTALETLESVLSPKKKSCMESVVACF